MKVRIYKKTGGEPVGEYITRNVFEDSFYHREMPSLTARQCREILDSISPDIKLNSERFVIEDMSTGHTGGQGIYRKGTILNF